MSKTRPEFIKSLYSPYKEVYSHILLDKNVKWLKVKENVDLLDGIITKDLILKLTALHPIFFLSMANTLEYSTEIVEEVKKSLLREVKIELNAFLSQK